MNHISSLHISTMYTYPNRDIHCTYVLGVRSVILEGVALMGSRDTYHMHTQSIHMSMGLFEEHN